MTDSSSLRLVLSTSLVLVLATTVNANLLRNPGFEAVGNNGNPTIQDLNPPDEWYQLFGNPISVTEDGSWGLLRSNWFQFPAIEGDSFAASVGGPGVTNGIPALLGQSLTTPLEAGNQYQLSLQMILSHTFPNASMPAETGTLELYGLVGPGDLNDLVFIDAIGTATDHAWTSQSIAFSANEPWTDIFIVSKIGPETTLNLMGFDNLDLSEIPEPSTLALLIIMGVGLYRGRTT